MFSSTVFAVAARSPRHIVPVCTFLAELFPIRKRGSSALPHERRGDRLPGRPDALHNTRFVRVFPELWPMRPSDSLSGLPRGPALLGALVLGSTRSAALHPLSLALPPHLAVWGLGFRGQSVGDPKSRTHLWNLGIERARAHPPSLPRREDPGTQDPSLLGSAREEWEGGRREEVQLTACSLVLISFSWLWKSTSLSFAPFQAPECFGLFVFTRFLTLHCLVQLPVLMIHGLPF